MKDFFNLGRLAKQTCKSAASSSALGGLYVDDSLIDLSAALDSHGVSYIPSETISQVETPIPGLPLEGNVEAILRQPIGQRLSQAGLLPLTKLQLVLEDQKHQPDLQLGEILLLRGWIQETTLTFFLNLEAAACCPQFRSLPIGERLQRAGLVSEADIQKALQEQKQLRGKLGQILALQGVVSQLTADYFARL